MSKVERIENEIQGLSPDELAEFRDWFLATVAEHTVLREEQRAVSTFALVPDRDMAGARGVAIAALEAVRGTRTAAAPLG